MQNNCAVASMIGSTAGPGRASLHLAGIEKVDKKELKHE